AALWMNERGARGNPWIWRAAAALAFAAALLCKEGAVPAIAVLAALAWPRLASAPDRWKRLAIEIAPWLVILAAWAYLHQRVAPGVLAPSPGWRHPTAAERLWTSIATLPAYLAMLVPGTPQGPDWLIAPARSPADPRVILGVILHLAALVLLVRWWGRRWRLAAAVVFLWLPLAMIGGLTFARGVLFYGGRHLYMASAGATWLVGAGVAYLWRRGLAPTTFPRWTLAAGYAAMTVVC